MPGLLVIPTYFKFNVCNHYRKYSKTVPVSAKGQIRIQSSEGRAVKVSIRGGDRVICENTVSKTADLQASSQGQTLEQQAVRILQIDDML